MSVRVTVSRRLEDLPTVLKVPTKVMQEIGDWAINTIRSRTERGLSVDGSGFAPLSAGYAKAKAKAGLSPTADLTVSGRMLNDMRATVPQPGVTEIRFTSQGGGSGRGTFIQRSRALGAADKAYFHHVAGAGRSRVVRRFFDLSPQEIQQVVQKVRAHYTEVLR